MEVWEQAKSPINLQGLLLLLLLSASLFCGPCRPLLWLFKKGHEANLWFFLVELHSFALKTWPIYNPGVFNEPESSTKCYKSNTKHLQKLPCFHHRIAGEISPHYLRSRGEIWWRLSFHDSLGVFPRLISIILFETLALFNFVRSSLKVGNRPSPAIKMSLWESCSLKLAMIITLLPSPGADPFLNVYILTCIFRIQNAGPSLAVGSFYPY